MLTIALPKGRSLGTSGPRRVVTVMTVLVHKVDNMTMLAGDSAELRKARGAFFTPSALCDYVVEWAVRDGSEDVLEPSCGEAAFLLSTAARLDHLGVRNGGKLAGVELHEASAAG